MYDRPLMTTRRKPPKGSFAYTGAVIDKDGGTIRNG